ADGHILDVTIPTSDLAIFLLQVAERPAQIILPTENESWLVPTEGAKEAVQQLLDCSQSDHTDGGHVVKFGGVGLTLEQDESGIFVRDIRPGRPAERAGLRAGDRVMEVEGEPTQTLGVDEATARLRGIPGTAVHLLVRSKKTQLEV